MIELERLKQLAEDRWLIVEQSKGKKVLEVGCVNHSIEGVEEQRRIGTWLFDYLHAFAAHATGIDIDVRAVEYLAKHGLDVRFGDAQHFELGERYELIVVSKVIDHLMNLDGFFSSCVKHLTSDGIIMIADDNILCLPQLLQWYRKKRLGTPDNDITVKVIPEHFRFFVRRYGLDVLRIQYATGTGNSHTLRLFRRLEKILPKKWIYAPLFYPSYIVELKRHNTSSHGH